MVVLLVQIDTVHRLKAQIYPILSEEIALIRDGSLERFNLHQKHDYPFELD